MKSRVSKSKCEISLTGIITPINLSHLSTSGLAGPPLSLSICLALNGTCVRVQRMEGEKDEGKSQRMVSKLLVFFFSPTAGQRQPGQEAPSCPSTICRAPGAARIYPHRACEQQPPTHPASSTQHPVAGGSSLSEGICVFLERQGPLYFTVQTQQHIRVSRHRIWRRRRDGCPQSAAGK